MPKILKMEEAVFSKIAAGEVVERPASVLKELIENSIDAKATRIDVEAQGAGQKLLRVSDDGTGMDREDLRLCLEPHATSKIKSIEDLDRLSTFGFRGEALAAVSAVSEVMIFSSLEGQSQGWKIKAQAGKIREESPAPGAGGTTLEVGNLFFNTPARLKFLKSDEFERGKIISVIEEAALANPEIAFSLKTEGKKRLSFEAARNGENAEKDRIAMVLGESLGQYLTFGEETEKGIRLRLFVSTEAGLVNNRKYQHWFVNRRPIDSRLLQQALYRAFGPHILQGRHPVCVGYLEISPVDFDVNVHPAKREIRFKNEGEIFNLIVRVISKILSQSLKPQVLVKDSYLPPIGLDSHSESLALESAPSYSGSLRNAVDASLPFGEPILSQEKNNPGPDWFTPPYRYLGQIERSYLVFEALGGIFILDQHAASECVLFERYGDLLLKGRVVSERLILPVAVSFPASSVSAIMDRKSNLFDLGFEVEAFGKGMIQVTATPPLLKKDKDVEEALHKIAEDFSDPAASLLEVRRKSLATMACKAAVKAHDFLGEQEAMALLLDLSKARQARNCPHGRPTMLALNRTELARRFGRPGAIS